MLTFIQEYSRFIAVAFKIIHNFLCIIFDLCNSPTRHEKLDTDKLHNLIHSRNLVVQLFQIRQFIFGFNAFLHILCVHDTGTLFRHGTVDILLDLLGIFGFNINRDNNIVDIDDFRKPEFIYVFRIAVNVQDNFIAVTCRYQLFAIESDTALRLYFRNKAFILL